MAQQQEFISVARQNAQQLWNAYEALKSMQDQWNALDYGNTLQDGTGANAGITHQQVGAVVFDTINAIKAIMDAGSATNVSKLL